MERVRTHLGFGNISPLLCAHKEMVGRDVKVVNLLYVRVSVQTHVTVRR